MGCKLFIWIICLVLLSVELGALGIVFPENVTYYDSSVELSVSGSDFFNWKYSLDGGEGIYFNPNVTLEELSDGEHNVKVYGVVEDWKKTFEGYSSGTAFSIQPTLDEGYVVAGSTKSFFDWDSDFWVVKLYSNGSGEWNKTIGGEKNDFAKSIQQTSDGGYVIAGSTRSFGRRKKEDAWIVKLNSSGDHEWNKTVGGRKNDFAKSIQQTSDGGYVIAGVTESYGAGLKDAWVVKLNSSGDHEWNKTVGGERNDFAKLVKQTSDGGYVVAISTKSFGAGRFDCLFIKLDEEGNHEWNTTYDAGGFLDYANSIQQTDDEGYIITGSMWPLYTYDGNRRDSWVVKLDKHGDKEWDRNYRYGLLDGFYSVKQTSDGYIVNGYKKLDHGSNFSVEKLDEEGNHEWNITYKSVLWERVYSVQQTSDGYVAMGRTKSFGSRGSDFWVAKLSEKMDSVNFSVNLPEEENETEEVFVKVISPERKVYESSSVELNVLSYGIFEWKYSLDGGEEINFTPNITLENLSEGSHNVKIYGISEDYIKMDSVDFVVDLPEENKTEIFVKLISPENITYNDSSVDLNVSGENVSYWKYSLDGKDFIFTPNITLENLSEGSHNVKVQGVFKKWNITYGGEGSEEVNSIQQTLDGGYIIAGSTNSYGAGDYDFWVLRLDGEGEEKWNKTFGGVNDDKAYSVQQTLDGGYIIAGSTNSYGAGDYDFWVLRLDGEGEEKWNRTYGGSKKDLANFIEQFPDDGYVVVGYTESSDEEDNFLVVKLYENGSQEWNKTYKEGSLDEESDDGIGSWMVNLDKSGNYRLNKMNGDELNEGVSLIRQTSDGGHVIAGHVGSSVGDSDFWVARLSEKIDSVDFVVDLNGTEEVFVKINSPQYTNNYMGRDINLNVSGEDIYYWFYSLDYGEYTGFIPNTTLDELPLGVHNIRVYGIGESGLYMDSVDFSVGLPDGWREFLFIVYMELLLKSMSEEDDDPRGSGRFNIFGIFGVLGGGGGNGGGSETDPNPDPDKPDPKPNPNPSPDDPKPNPEPDPNPENPDPNNPSPDNPNPIPPENWNSYLRNLWILNNLKIILDSGGGVNTDVFVNINSPKNLFFYNDSDVDLNVSGDKIVYWLYSLDYGEYTTFIPNITLEGLSLGVHNIRAYGIGEGNLYMDSVDFFVVDLPDEGDDKGDISVEIVFPQERIYNEEDIELKVSGKDVSYWVYSLDDGEYSIFNSNVVLERLSEGVHNVKIYGMSEGKSGRDSVDFGVDLTNPAIYAPEIDLFVSDVGDLIFVVNDTNIDVVKYSVNGNETKVVGSNFTILRGNFSEEGEYVINVSAVDKAGNEKEMVLTFVVDKTSPEIVKEHGLDDGAFVVEVTEDFVFNVSDDYGVVEVSYSVNDNETKVVGSNFTILRGNFSEEDEYVINVSAVDKVGNENEIILAFVVDKTSPEIVKEHGLDDGAFVVEVTEDFVFNVSDRSIAGVSYSINGNETKVVGSNFTILSGNFSEEGEYVINVSAVDKAGNENEIILAFVVDKTSPEIVKEHGLDDGAFVVEVTEDFVFNVSDDYGVVEVSYSVNDNETKVVGSNFTILSGNFSEEGEYVINVSAVDKVGNFEFYELIFNVDYGLYDVSLKIISPENITYHNDSVGLNVFGDGVISWNYSLDGGGNVSFVPNITLENLSEGNHSVEIYGIGENDVQMDSVNFSVDLPEGENETGGNSTNEDNGENDEENNNGRNNDDDDEGGENNEENNNGRNNNNNNNNNEEEGGENNEEDILIRIISPRNKIYENDYVDLNVSGESVISWNYSLDGGDNVSFEPNISLSGLSNGSHTVKVYGMGEGTIKTDSVDFFVNLLNEKEKIEGTDLDIPLFENSFINSLPDFDMSGMIPEEGLKVIRDNGLKIKRYFNEGKVSLNFWYIFAGIFISIPVITLFVHKVLKKRKNPMNIGLVK